MKTTIKIFLVIGAVSARNLSQRGAEEEKVLFEEGFNPGQSNSQSGSGSGYHGDGLNQGEAGSGYNGGNQGESGSGYNGGSQGESGSGYNGGNQNNAQSNNNMNSGFHPGSGGSFNPHIPDFVPDESITNSGGGSFFNPGRDNGLHPGSNRPDSRPDPSGRPDSQVNSNTGFNPGTLGFSGFRTPIVFAEDEEEEEVEVQSVGEESEDGPRVILLQSYPAGYYPLIQTLPAGFVPASTLPARASKPYQPGGDKQQYARGTFIQSVQTLPSEIVFAGEEMAPYVPGSNKQQYLRGGRPAQPQYVPLIRASNPLTGSSVGVSSLPSPIVFAPAEPAASPSSYVPGTNKQQYLRGRQTKPFNDPEYNRPLIEVSGPDSAVQAQTLPGGLVFAAYDERAPYVPGGNKQPYMRDGPPRPTIAAPPSLAGEERFVLLTPRRETRPAPVARQPFLRAREEDQPALFPGVSSRPSFPPGFPPRQFSTYNQELTANQGYDLQGLQGPK